MDSAVSSAWGRLTELSQPFRRRLVFRTAATYAAAGFVLLQAADLILPVITQSDWPYRALVVATIAGFPIALVAAWLIERRGVPIHHVAPGLVLGGKRVGIVIGVLVVLSAVWLIAMRARASTLDPDLIAVVPFRVSGADRSLDYLHEGMVDLFAAKLSGAEGARALDPRSVITAWDRQGGEKSSEREVLRIAEDLTAGRALLGEVVGTPASLTITARIVNTVTGRTLARESERGAVDQLSVLVDRLAAKLLSLDAGEGADRLAMLTSTSLPALQEYLAGQQDYRKARFKEAQEHFRQAVGHDSTFVLAALGMQRVNGWSGVQMPPALLRPYQWIAWKGRDRLGAVDRAYLTGLLGSRFPEPATEAEKCEGYNRAVSLAPDRAELWHWVGDCHFHFSRTRDTADRRALASVAFRRALQADSNHLPTLQHLVQLAAMAGDSSEAARLGGLYLRAPGAEGRAAVEWWIAYARSDSLALRRLAQSVDSVSRPNLLRIIDFQEQLGEGIEYVDSITQTMHNLFQRDPTPGNAVVALRLALNHGRFEDARQWADSLDRFTAALGAGRASRVEAALYGELDPTTTQRDAEGLFGLIRDRSAQPALRLEGSCLLAQWEAWRGDQRAVAENLVQLSTRSPTADSILANAASRTCQTLVAAITAVKNRQPDARAHVLRLDSIVMQNARFSQTHNYIHLAAARLHEKMGDDAAALKSVRRTSDFMHYDGFRAVALREEGRLSDKLGDRETAIRAYRHYLSLRGNPVGDTAQSTRAVRDALVRLTAER